MLENIVVKLLNSGDDIVEVTPPAAENCDEVSVGNVPEEREIKLHLRIRIK
jgi:hypothetical protein